MEIIEENNSLANNKSSRKSNANSDRLFIETAAELLGKGHKVKFRAPGDSMFPTILNGDEITVEPIKPEATTIGDIVRYLSKNGVIAHRVLRIKNKRDSHSHAQASVLDPQPYFILRGDAAMVCDDSVSADRILGKVKFVEREGRRIDPYCLRIKLHYKTRRFGSRIKRLLRHFDSLSA